MINIDKIKGKAIKYTYERSKFFTNGEYYRIGVANGRMFTVDDDGDDHEVEADHLERAFDVSEYIEKPSLVGKYVRYIGDYSDFMRTGDIGIVMAARGDGSGLEVKWLNPNKPHTQSCPTWFCCTVNVEVVG